MKQISISIHFVNEVIKHARARGLDTDLLLQRSRISPRLICENQSRVTAKQFAQLQYVTMQEMGDEMLGYLPKPLKLGHWSALCHWLIGTSNLGQAMRRCCLFYEMTGTAMRIRLLTENNSTLLIVEPCLDDGSQLEPYGYELAMFGIHRLICWLTESIPSFEQIALSYQKPEHCKEYVPLFLGAPTQFNQSFSGFVFSTDLLSLPIKRNSESLTEFLRDPLYRIIVNDYHSRSWTQQVRNIIDKDLSNPPRFLDIASELNINPKRLRRLLQEEGLTYSELKLQLRRDAAIHYLSKQMESVEQIAFKTGFSESSAFIRAFKKWTGVTPYIYRKGVNY